MGQLSPYCRFFVRLVLASNETFAHAHRERLKLADISHCGLFV